jgi:biopolymer transport protein ExbD
MRFRDRQRQKPTINIVSMIDILCLLLIFFIVTTVFKKEQPAVQIDLPESSTAQATKEELPSTLFVTAKDEVFLDEQPVAILQLASVLKKKTAEKPSFKVALKSSKQASFGTIVKVMDAAKIAGIKQLPAYTEETPAPVQP